MTTLTALHASRARRLLALAALAIPGLLTAIDISVAGVALPSIARSLHPSASELLWIVDGYNYLLAGSMLTMGAVADRFGRRKVLIVCAVVFAVASAVGAFAPSAAVLIVARGVMGIAGSAVLPASMSLLGTIFPDARARMQAMGAFMTVFLLGMLVSPFVGGLLLDHFWWGSVFLIGAPVMVIAIVTVPLLVPELRADAPPRIDVTSTALSIVAILALVFALKSALNEGPSIAAGIAVLLGAATAVLFVRRQRRLEHPLIDFGALRAGAVGQPLAAMFLTALLMGGSSLFFNLYLQEVQGLTALQAAVWAVPQMLAMILASNLGPWLTRHFDRNRVIVVALGIMTLGFVSYAFLPTTEIGRPWLAAGGALATLGVGAAYPLLLDRVIGSAPPERAAATAALAQVSNELGIAVGLTVLGSVGTLVYRGLLGMPGSPAETSVVTGVQHALAGGGAAELRAVHAAYTGAFDIVGAIGVVVMIVVIVLVARRRARPALAPEHPDVAITTEMGATP